MKKYGEAAVVEMIMAALPEIAKNVAESQNKGRQEERATPPNWWVTSSTAPPRLLRASPPEGEFT